MTENPDIWKSWYLPNKNLFKKTEKKDYGFGHPIRTILKLVGI